MEFTADKKADTSYDAGDAAATKKKTVASMVGQTWTKQVGCKDPNCKTEHDHEWALQPGVEGDEAEADKEEKEEKYVGPADRIVSVIDVLDPTPEEGERFVSVIGKYGIIVLL